MGTTYLRASPAQAVVRRYVADLYENVHEAEPHRVTYEDVHGVRRWRNLTEDIFGCIDVLACTVKHPPRSIPDTWALQVTTPSKVYARKKKIAERRWPLSWRVSVVCVRREGPREAYLEVHDREHSRWERPLVIPIDPALLAAREQVQKATAEPKGGPALKAAIKAAKDRKEQTT